jgi:uncharacterized protein YciI
MFIMILRFSKNKDRAEKFRDGHKAWLKRGFDDGVFLLAGRIQPGLGGGLLAHYISLPDLQTRVGEDPFVADNVTGAEILEFNPAMADERLNFLIET